MPIHTWAKFGLPAHIMLSVILLFMVKKLRCILIILMRGVLFDDLWLFCLRSYCCMQSFDSHLFSLSSVRVAGSLLLHLVLL